MKVGSKKMGGSASSVDRYLDQDEDGVKTDLRRSSEAVGDYFEDRAEGTRVVWGELGRELGLEQSGISRDAWRDMFDGKVNGEEVVRIRSRAVMVEDPETGKMVPKLDDNGDRVMEKYRVGGIDFRYAVPKGVSELYARATTQAEADRIAQAVMNAVKVSWEEAIEETGRLARVPLPKDAMEGRLRGSNTERVAAKLLATPVLHTSARPTDATVSRGAPADPHLHVHVFTFSACKVGDKWYTADEYAVKTKENAEYRTALADGELIRNLEALGYAVDKDDFDTSRSGRVTYEPAASTPELRKHWSSNHERALVLSREFELKYDRPPTDVELNDILQNTKGKKEHDALDPRTNRERWVDDARDHGLDCSPVERGRAIEPPADRYQVLWNRLMDSYDPNDPTKTNKGLVRDDATFSDASIRPAIARCAVGLGFDRDELKALEVKLRAQLEVSRPANDERFKLYTTRTQLDKEAFIEVMRREKARAQLEAVPQEILQKAFDLQPIDLDQEQRDGVIAACSTAAWVHIEGYAGSGKTTDLKAIMDAHRLAGTGDQFVVASTAAATAERTGQKLGADKWGSVESIVTQIRNGKLRMDEHTVVFVDEAAMMDTNRMHALLRHTGNARMVLVGDSAQLSPIGAAGWYAESVDQHGSVMLTNVHRHRNAEDVKDYALLRKGQANKALKNLHDRGRVWIDETKDDRLARLMRDYKAMRDIGYSADEIRQVIETSNNDVDLVNRFIQRDRIERDELSRQGFEVEDTEQDRRWTLHVGDQVIFLRSHMADGTPVKNGTTAVIESLTRDGQAGVRIGEKLVSIRLNASERNQPVGIGYAVHASKLQGGEFPIVQMLPGTEHTANANSAYSQWTRAQHEAHAYLSKDVHGEDALGNYAKACSVPFEKRSATWHQMQSVVREAEGIMLKSEGRFDTSGAHVHPVNRFADPELAARADAHADYIAETFSEDLARRVANSSAYPALVIKLEELAAQGNDAHAMLADAITDRELATADDVAAGISYRLDSTPEVEDPGLHLNVATGYVDNFEFSYDYSEGDYEFTEDSYSVQRGVKGRGMSL